MKDINRRLAAADPMRQLAIAPVPDSAVPAMAQEIVMRDALAPPAPSSPLQRNRRGRLAALLVAGLAVGIPATAYAVDRMHSGFFGSGGEAVAGEEYLYTDAPEIRDVVRDLAGEFPLPPGASLDPVVNRYPTAERMLVQRTGLGQEVALNAACAWYRDWQRGGDARARAQHVIEQVPTWTYLRIQPDGDGPNVLERIATQTRRGDGSTLSQFVVANC